MLLSPETCTADSLLALIDDSSKLEYALVSEFVEQLKLRISLVLRCLFDKHRSNTASLII